MKTIVVTGTSSGIGFEICTQAAKLNHKVIEINLSSIFSVCQEALLRMKKKEVAKLSIFLQLLEDIEVM